MEKQASIAAPALSGRTFAPEFAWLAGQRRLSGHSLAQAIAPNGPTRQPVDGRFVSRG